MESQIRFANSALSSMPPPCQRPVNPMLKIPLPRLPLSSRKPSASPSFSPSSSSLSAANARRKERPFMDVGEQRERNGMGEEKGEVIVLYSFNPFSLLFLAALPGAETVRSIFAPFVELVKTWDLPEWLVHWGHPGSMAVVLFAMGGYGSYLGFRIRLSKNAEERAMAKDLHPKLLAGMFFFFALGATGGITALLTSDKPILESPHAVSGLMGLSLLTIQTMLPAFFKVYIIAVINECYSAMSKEENSLFLLSKK
ncbi:hypothetical protein AXF42_Ash018954 [Apostasia shenzhenica]|uniref:Uncharacterized protein n=1 Tax=Apostasia shenzhenica TaxID=1088818 RepID=A0A2I0B4M0_9ASPA|nr:hypothetical protein AXF42_Ash018954 [Apostasia shenzhenica]